MTDVVESTRKLIEALGPVLVASGLTCSQLNYLLRNALVREASRSLRLKNGRANNSQIAAAVGLSRSEVGTILATARKNSNPEKVNLPPSPIERIVSAWRQDTRFRAKTGIPRKLAIRGAGNTLEKLLTEFGGDLYPAALLAELRRQGYVELVNSSARLRKPLLRSTRAPSIDRELGDLFGTLSVLAHEWNRLPLKKKITIRAADRLEADVLSDRAQAILESAVKAIEALVTEPVIKGKAKSKSQREGKRFLIVGFDGAAAFSRRQHAKAKNAAGEVSRRNPLRRPS